MTKKNEIRWIVFAALISIPLLTQAQTADDAAIQTIQTEVDIAKSKADKNAAEIESMKGGIPQAIAAEAAAREAADQAHTSAIEANASAIAAEESARLTAENAERTERAAADAALSEGISAEREARIAADEQLESEMEAYGYFLEGVSERVSVLEGIHFGRRVSWTETENYEFTSVADAISSLNYQPGEWLAWLFTDRYGREWGFCSDHPDIAQWFNGFVSGQEQDFLIISAQVLYNGTWVPRSQYYLSFLNRQYSTGWARYIFSYSYAPQLGLYQRYPDGYAMAEILASGFSVGNTATIIIGSTREMACGF